VRDDEAVRSLARDVRARIVREGDDHPGAIETVRFHLRVREHVADRLRYCLRLPMNLNAGDLAGLSLPRPLAFGYYLMRPVGLVLRARRRARSHRAARDHSLEE